SDHSEAAFATMGGRGVLNDDGHWMFCCVSVTLGQGANLALGLHGYLARPGRSRPDTLARRETGCYLARGGEEAAPRGGNTPPTTVTTLYSNQRTHDLNTRAALTRLGSARLTLERSLGCVVAGRRYPRPSPSARIQTGGSYHTAPSRDTVNSTHLITRASLLPAVCLKPPAPCPPLPRAELKEHVHPPRLLGLQRETGGREAHGRVKVKWPPRYKVTMSCFARFTDGCNFRSRCPRRGREARACLGCLSDVVSVEKQGDRVDDLRQEKGQLGGEMLSSDLRCLPEPVTLVCPFTLHSCFIRLVKEDKRCRRVQS
ncbi:hypothetical protein BaRGS_00010430, partial [Batillaria attramentaria]